MKKARLDPQKEEKTLKQIIVKYTPYLTLIGFILLWIIFILICFQIGGTESAKVYNNPSLINGGKLWNYNSQHLIKSST